MQVHTYLDLSTAHLTPATRVWLEAIDFEKEGPSGGSHPHGWNFYAHDDNSSGHYAHNNPTQPMPEGTPDGEWPADLWACFCKARELGCTRVHFDQDAEASDELPCYDDTGKVVPAEEIG